MKITIQQLEDMGACAEGLDVFRDLIGDEWEGEWTPIHQVAVLWDPLARSFLGWLWREGVVPQWSMAGANLRGANLYGANLYGADLRGADLRDADLRGADVCGADLADANLYGADLRGADLRGADLCGANLRGANLGLHNAGNLKRRGALL